MAYRFIGSRSFKYVFRDTPDVRGKLLLHSRPGEAKYRYLDRARGNHDAEGIFRDAVGYVDTDTFLFSPRSCRYYSPSSLEILLLRCGYWICSGRKHHVIFPEAQAFFFNAAGIAYWSIPIYEKRLSS